MSKKTYEQIKESERYAIALRLQQKKKHPSHRQGSGAQPQHLQPGDSSVHLFYSPQWLPMQSSQPQGRGQCTFRPASVHSFSIRAHSPWPTDLPEGAPA